jgi:hypothetical protein
MKTLVLELFIKVVWTALIIQRRMKWKDNYECWLDNPVINHNVAELYRVGGGTILKILCRDTINQYKHFCAIGGSWWFWWCSFGLSRRVDWLVEASVSEKRYVSIFSPSTNQSTERLNPKEHNENCRRRENLRSHTVLHKVDHVKF